jgi:SAM-dependent methyltransferase
MGVIGGSLGYHSLRLSERIVKWYYGGEPKLMDGSAYDGKSKMEVLLGVGIWNDIAGASVLDFGCGTGSESVEMALHGARRVVGLDIVAASLDAARQLALQKGVSQICEFKRETSEKFDVILSFDAFEHYENPEAVLKQMAQLTNPDGVIIVSFGAPWYHPLGGHTFSVFPWAHLLFTEKALIRWRSDFKNDGATRFSEVEGGLNQMTIRRFEELVERSPFRFVEFQTVPIRAMRPIANRWTREFTSSTIRCRMKLR